MTQHKIAWGSGITGVEVCLICGASHDWIKRTPWLKDGKPQPYCEGKKEEIR